jgi:hypothetical protein
MKPLFQQQSLSRDLKHYLGAAILLFSLVFNSLPASAEAPLGDWMVRGQNPADERVYKGQVSVIKSGDTYTVLWRFGATTYIGTGIDVGTHFAVTFKPAESMDVGLLLLQKKDGVWQGKWTQMGSQSVGIEAWKKLGS